MPSLWAPPIGMRRSPPPPARRGGIESALLAPGVSRAVEYRRDAEHHGVSPFEDLARLARRLDALRDDDDDDDAEDSSDVDARLAAAWTAARRAAEGRAELRPALTLLAQCMERRANVAAARREERETCARELLATVNEMRDRVESALDEEGLLEPARRAWSAARSSPDASPQPTAAHVVASPPEEFEEDVAAIDADRRRVSALPAPLGITPPVCVAREPEMEDKRVGRRRREAAAQETDERVRKQRRDFSFDLVTPTLSTTPEEEDEDAIRRDENQNQNQNQNQTQTEDEDEDEDDGEGGDAEVDENARRASAKRSDPPHPVDDGEESGYSAEAELTPSVRESLSIFGGGTQSQ